MSFRADLDSDNSLPPSGEESFRLLAIYDSELSGSEAESALGLVEHELAGEVPINKSFWALHSLDSEALSSRAAAEAANADMIIVALGSKTNLAQIKSWVASWQKNREQNGGLITLLQDAPDSELKDFFAEAAVTANMDFLCRGKHNRLN